MNDTRLARGEELICIDIPDSNVLKIKGILQGTLDKPVAVMVHGRPGMPVAYEHTLTGRFFNQHGITYLRLYMYDIDSNSRNHEDTNLETYTRDFETVLAYLSKQGVPKVFGIGHSYGGLAILNSSAVLDAAVLWEPAHGSYWTELQGAKPSTSKKRAEYETLGDTTALAAHKGYPLKIISAGGGKLTKFHERYISVADVPKNQIVIEGAQHNLSNTLPILDELRQETADWLVQFI